MSALSQSRITPFLWFDQNAEAAVDFYLGIFPNSRRTSEMRLPADAPAGEGSRGRVLTIGFELDGQPFAALNGGPMFQFNEAVSFVVRCETQQEVDRYWGALTAEGGEEGRCGWLKDRFGLSWQVVPARIGELLRHPKAMQAMMGMKKLDIAELEHAAKE